MLRYKRLESGVGPMVRSEHMDTMRVVSLRLSTTSPNLGFLPLTFGYPRTRLVPPPLVSSERSPSLSVRLRTTYRSTSTPPRGSVFLMSFFPEPVGSLGRTDYTTSSRCLDVLTFSTTPSSPSYPSVLGPEVLRGLRETL